MTYSKHLRIWATLLLFVCPTLGFSKKDRGNLILVSTKVSGTLSPFTVLVDGHVAAHLPETVANVKMNGISIYAGKGPSFPFFTTTYLNELHFEVTTKDGKKKELPPFSLPTLDSIQILRPKRLVFNLTGDIEQVHIDGKRITVAEGKGSLQEGPHWFSYNHIVKVEGPGDKPGRLYNLRIFKKREIAYLKEKGEIKPGEIVRRDPSSFGKLLIMESDFNDWGINDSVCVWHAGVLSCGKITLAIPGKGAIANLTFEEDTHQSERYHLGIEKIKWGINESLCINKDNVTARCGPVLNINDTETFLKLPIENRLDVLILKTESRDLASVDEPLAEFNEVYKATPRVIGEKVKATPWSVGLEFGLNISNVATVPDAGTNSFNTFSGGVFLEIPISQVFSIVPGAFYALKGGATPSLTDQFNYLDLPLVVKAKLPAPQIEPYIFAGGYFSFLLDATQTGSTGITHIYNITEPMDFGLVFGAGGELAIGWSSYVFLNARYSMGLKDIDPSAGFSTKNNVLLLTGGIKFNI